MKTLKNGIYYSMLHLSQNPSYSYFVGLFNYERVWKCAKNKCMYKISKNEALSIAKDFNCNIITEYNYKDNVLVDRKTFKL